MSDRKGLRPLALLTLVVLSISSGMGSPVKALQPGDQDASDPPTTTGPLIGANPLGCEDAGEPGPGEVIAQSCSWSYELIPLESNPAEDFGAYWIQMEIHPGKGECAKELIFDVEPPSGGRITSASPDASARVNASKPTVSGLIVDAEGAAPVPGGIHQEVTYGKGNLTVTVSEQKYSFHWVGSSKNKIIVAIGVEIAHEPLLAGAFSLGRERVGFGMGPCRPFRPVS